MTADRAAPCPFCGAHLGPIQIRNLYPMTRFHPGTVRDGKCVLSGLGFREADMPLWAARAVVEDGGRHD